MNVSKIALYVTVPQISNRTQITNPKESLSLQCQPKTDTISFKGRTLVKDVRDLRNLTCACCEIEMIPNNIYDDLTAKKLSFPAPLALKETRNLLNINSPNTPRITKAAFAFLEGCAKSSPTRSVNLLLGAPLAGKQLETMSVELRAEVDRIVKKAKFIAYPSSFMFKEIEKIHPKLHENEQGIYEKLQTYSTFYPDETIEQILNKPEIKSEHLNNLQKKQREILRSMKMIAKSMSPESKEKINLLIDNAMKNFHGESTNVTPKRKRVIQSFYDIEATIPEKKIMNRILTTLSKLPNSQTDIDAFMVKYSQRSSNETIEVLLGRSRNTFEHIKPHHRPNDNGGREKENGICLCAKCNLERQQTPYDIFLLMHPEMYENTQKQINQVISAINKGILIGYDYYPIRVQISLLDESKQKLKIDYSELNLIKAALNRRINIEKLKQS